MTAHLSEVWKSYAWTQISSMCKKSAKVYLSCMEYTKVAHRSLMQFSTSLVPAYVRKSTSPEGCLCVVYVLGKYVWPLWVQNWGDLSPGWSSRGLIVRNWLFYSGAIFMCITPFWHIGCTWWLQLSDSMKVWGEERVPDFFQSCQIRKSCRNTLIFDPVFRVLFLRQRGKISDGITWKYSLSRPS